MLAVLERVDAELAGLLDRNLDFLDPVERKAAVVLIEKIASRRAALTMRLLSGASVIAHEVGNKDASTWYADTINADARAATAQVRLAGDLETRWHRVADALAAGQVSADQASVVVHALNQVGKDAVATYEDAVLAEKLLLAEAATKTPGELRALGRRILEVIDPDRFEAAEAKALAHEEEAAAARTFFRTRDNHDGTTDLHARIPTVAAKRVQTYVDAYAQPARQAHERDGGDGARAPFERLRGEGFVELVEHLDPAVLPRHGGDATTLIVTLDFDSLRRDLGTATIGFEDEGVRISAGEARRLACNAGIIPMVLNGASEILDQGRAKRLHTSALRKAVRTRDRCCRGEGCSFPAVWSQVHHFEEWAKGGSTDLHTAGLLCPHHHRIAHDPRYTHAFLPDGSVRFTRDG